MKRTIFIASLLTLAACGGGSGSQVLEIDGTAYSIPSAHISSINREPHTFVRVKNPGAPFQLVYDSRSVGAQSGPGVPRIFSINDEGQTGVEYHDAPSGLIVCRKAVHPNGGCGTIVKHRGAEWAVLFPIERLPQAARITADAATLLDRYTS